MIPKRCVVFEDSLAGVASGCKVVGVTSAHAPEELKDTDLTVDNFVDLEPEWLISKLF